MKLNQAGIDLIKSFEKCRLKAYPDPISGGKPYTIGWGSTAGVKPGDVWTQTKADSVLASECEEWCKGIKAVLKVELTDNQFSALVSLVHNIGMTQFKSSTLLKMLNDNKIKEAADQFPRWNKAGGKVVLGLTRRRAAERKLYIT